MKKLISLPTLLLPVLFDCDSLFGHEDFRRSNLKVSFIINSYPDSSLYQLLFGYNSSIDHCHCL